MIRHELSESTLRFYNNDSNNPFEPYDAVCTVMWETHEIIWLKAFHGTISRKLLRELVQWFIDQKITVVKAHRAGGHSIPFMKQVNDHIELNVQDVAAILKML